MIGTKAQLLPLQALLGVVVTLILWALFFGDQLNYWGDQAIVQFGLTGFTALAFAHVNISVILASSVVMVAISFGGTSS